MIAKKLPFFSHHSQEIEQCLRGDSCQGIEDLINTPGIVEDNNIFSLIKPF